MDVLKEQRQCPSMAVGAIVDLVGAAFAAGGGPSELDYLDDLEQIIDALHVLRPASADFAFFDGWLDMLRKNWEDAEATFRDLIVRSQCLPASKGMLLRCLKAREAFGWQDEAKMLLEEYGDNDDVGRLARALLASEDLREAVAAGKRSGRFVAPESVVALETANATHKDSVAAASERANQNLLLSMQYLRA
jgi:type III secretion protein HrpB1